jgi:hypothetical protein
MVPLTVRPRVLDWLAIYGRAPDPSGVGVQPAHLQPGGRAGHRADHARHRRRVGGQPEQPRQALNAAAAHMAQYLRELSRVVVEGADRLQRRAGGRGGSLPAETQNYIKTILRGGPDRQGVPRQHPGGGGSGPLFGFKPDRVKIGTKNVLDQAGSTKRSRRR